MGEETLWQLLSETMILGVSLAELLGKLVLVLVVWGFAMAVQRVLVRLVGRALRKAEVPSASIVVNIVRAVIWFLALITVLEPVFGVQPTAFVATLGVGSVALSLGMQDTMANLIGGLTLMLSKVIEPGDAIRVGDFAGTVTDINWRSTSVRDVDGQVNVIPNSVISKTALVKQSERTCGRCQLGVVVSRDRNLEQVRADIALLACEVLGDRLDARLGTSVFVSGFDAAGIQTMVELHLSRGTSPDKARSVLAERLMGCPWVVRVG